jgi:phosphatidylglycerol:prolipoprotein diacylglycerol transferase
VYPVLFHLGSILIPAYGALAAVGVLLALLMAQRTARIAALDARKVWNLCVGSLFAALVFSRLLLVALNWSELRLHPIWLLSLAMIHHPLLACCGGLAAGAAAVLYGRWQRLPLWSTADALAAPVALGLAIEQLGALLAGSGYGIEAGTGIAARWAVTYTDPLAALWSGAPLGVALHPVQAYAALAFLALSIFLLVLCQGTTSQLAEKCKRSSKKRQGTTSVVPQMQQTDEWALAPEGRYFRFFLSSWLPYRRQSGDLTGLFLLGAGVAVFVTEFWRDAEGRGSLFGGALDGPQLAAVALVVVGGLVLLERKATDKG